MSDTKNLTRNQQRALDALLEYPTITQAAAACKLTDRTLRRYLAEPLFKTTLAAMDAERVDEAARILTKGQRAALKTLYDLMTAGASESTRRMAAATWMDLTMRLRESVLEKRIIDLEVKVYGQPKGTN